MKHASLLKEIARGQHGSRALSRADSAALFTDALGGTMPDGVLGALLVALRMKGETLDELLGLADAWRATHVPLHWPGATRLPIVLGSYNGARRQPNLLPLLACLLVRLGWPVLVHGVRQAGERVSTAAILAALGVDPSWSRAHAGRALATRGLAFVPIDVLSPALARLLAWRELLGVRHLGHTLVKLINPGDGPALVIASYTHGNYRQLMADACAALGGTSLLMRGAEGEAVASAHRLPPPLLCVPGATRELPGWEEARGAPLCGIDAQATADFTRRALLAPALVPRALRAQAAAVMVALGEATDPADAAGRVDAALGEGGHAWLP